MEKVCHINKKYSNIVIRSEPTHLRICIQKMTITYSYLLSLCHPVNDQRHFYITKRNYHLENGHARILGIYLNLLALLIFLIHFL